ncbi:MAG: hypothetical protein MJ211_01955 [Bacteroidales bacterium]|nr:hypothetical protein [Bacteroidales bacterium]
MNKNFYIFCLIGLVLFFYSCKEGYEKEIIGKWVLEKSEMLDLDSFCDYQSNQNISQLKNKINQIDIELSNISSDEIEKEKLLLQKENTQKLIEKYSSDSIKVEVLKHLDELVGNFYFNFNEDKTFSLSNSKDSIFGSWSILGDTISTLLSGNPAQDIIIKTLNSNKLEISTTEYFNDGFEQTTIMEFKKK